MKAVQLVALKTSVRVPQIISFMSDAAFGIIVQEKLPGTSLHEVLIHSPLLLRDDICDDLGSQLKTIVNHLSSLDDPRGFGQVDDDGGYRHTFHRHLFSRFTVPKCEVKTTEELIQWMAVQSLGKEQKVQEWLSVFDFSRPSIFSHGDLVPPNIMVEQNAAGRLMITGIIDWEAAGWYPYFWNHFIARFNDNRYGEAWKKVSAPMRMFPRESTAFYEMYGRAEIYAI
jgi:aminoglycoside phosphotransferase